MIVIFSIFFRNDALPSRIFLTFLIISFLTLIFFGIGIIIFLVLSPIVGIVDWITILASTCFLTIGLFKRYRSKCGCNFLVFLHRRIWKWLWIKHSTSFLSLNIHVVPIKRPPSFTKRISLTLRSCLNFSYISLETLCK